MWRINPNILIHTEPLYLEFAPYVRTTTTVYILHWTYLFSFYNQYNPDDRTFSQTIILSSVKCFLLEL